MRQLTPLAVLLAGCVVDVEPSGAGGLTPPGDDTGAGPRDSGDGGQLPDSGAPDAAPPDPDTGLPPREGCPTGWAPVEDHHGRSVYVQADTVWEGCHWGIEDLVVEAGATLSVRPWEGGSGGALRVVAMQILVHGTVSADGAGHGGGGGGGGGWMEDPTRCPEESWPGGVTPGLGGETGGVPGGEAGGDPLAATDEDTSACAGHGGAGGGHGGEPGGDAPDSPQGGPARGGKGGGDLGGVGGIPGVRPEPHKKPSPGGPGRPGGYLALAANGDTSVDRTVVVGSGGGGGGGGYAASGQCRGAGDGGPGGEAGGEGPQRGCAGGAGGGGGGSGGGSIELVATGTVQVSGSVTANGAGDPKLGGGYGAGGGVLIDAPKVVLGGQASMTSLGGGEDKDNGGTVKVFAGELEGQQHVRAGRLLVRPDE